MEESNTFKKLSSKSDELIAHYIDKQFPNYSAFNENDNDKFSANDFLVFDLLAFKTYIVEGKVRSKKYDTIMLEEVKFNRLLDKVKIYRKKGIEVDDALYYNIILDSKTNTSQCYCYKISDLYRKIQANDYYSSNTVSNPVTLHTTYSDMIEAKKPVYTHTYCPASSATDGHSTYTSKGVFYLPISMGKIIE